jgi:hypothetical protein
MSFFIACRTSFVTGRRDIGSTSCSDYAFITRNKSEGTKNEISGIGMKDDGLLEQENGESEYMQLAETLSAALNIAHLARWRNSVIVGVSEMERNQW